MHQAADRVLKRKEKTMKKRVRKITAILLAVSMVLGVSGCGKSQKSTQDSGDTAKVKIAYQYGLAYAPLTIMQEQGLIEKNYDGDIEVEWVSLNSGSAINEGMASGDIDVACMGIAPFITGVTAGIPYKMYGTIAAQPNELLTNEDTIHSLKDITDDKKISVVNVGSIQHILLAMLAKQELGDAHALDNNLVTMSHPDGMTALMSGSVACQLTTAPYISRQKNRTTSKRQKAWIRYGRKAMHLSLVWYPMTCMKISQKSIRQLWMQRRKRWITSTTTRKKQQIFSARKRMSRQKRCRNGYRIRDVSMI